MSAPRQSSDNNTHQTYNTLLHDNYTCAHLLLIISHIFTVRLTYTSSATYPHHASGVFLSQSF